MAWLLPEVSCLLNPVNWTETAFTTPRCGNRRRQWNPHVYQFFTVFPCTLYDIESLLGYVRFGVSLPKTYCPTSNGRFEVKWLMSSETLRAGMSHPQLWALPYAEPHFSNHICSHLASWGAQFTMLLEIFWSEALSSRTHTWKMQQMQQAAPLEILSQTFIDAVFKARRFGFRYLWVDSLCIIQDSKED
jgi:hypothetical protein